MMSPLRDRRTASRTAGRIILCALAGLVLARPADAGQVVAQTNLVTDDQSVNAAKITDPSLVNPWGMSMSPTSPFWISNNGTGTSTLYGVSGLDAVTKSALTVTIPGDGSVTGQVFNGTTAFNGDRFLFVSEDGTISGWRGALGTNAEVLQVGDAANVYKGSAIGSVGGNSYLYAANFSKGTIDVVKGDAAAPSLAGTFVDPNLPVGFAPFNIQNIGDRLYVTYALQDATGRDEVIGAGLGIINSFDLNGNFLARIGTSGTLNAPWGLAIAPLSFGDLAGDLLVGNFGDGTINAYNLTTNTFSGQLLGVGGSVLTIEGLWGLTTGNDGNGGSSQKLYFTAGPGDEQHGLFGSLTAVPEPSTILLAAIGGLLAARRLRTRPAPTA